MSKRIIVLGATGSIGKSAVDVLATHREDFEAVALAALRSREACEAAGRLLGAKAYTGGDAAMRAVENHDADICLVAMTGLAALAPTLAAIGKGMDVALATKEVLVMAGALVTAEAKRSACESFRSIASTARFSSVSRAARNLRGSC